MIKEGYEPVAPVEDPPVKREPTRTVVQTAEQLLQKVGATKFRMPIP